MTDRPIIFSGPMVRALIDGRKTQTRRLLRAQPPSECSIHYMLGNESWLPVEQRKPLVHCWEAWRGPLFEARPAKALAGGFTAKMPCKPDDRLWVRENWRALDKVDCLAPRNLDGDSGKITFEADPENRNPLWAFGKLRPAIHMPRWASRLTLTVTDVRVQRLQDISEEDARAEGVLYVPGHGDISPADLAEGYSNYLNCRMGFEVLWDSLNAKRAPWDSNPWIVALTFTVAHGNIDSSPLAPMTPNLRCGDRRSGFGLPRMTP